MIRYREPLDDAGSLLTLAARGHRSASEDARLAELWQRVGPKRCREIANMNKVSVLMASALESVLGEDLPETERALLAKNELRVRALIDALCAVLDRCGPKRHEVAVVEGGGTLLDSDLPLRAFGAGDIDLLVGREAWNDLIAALESVGFEPADRRGRPTTRGEFVRHTADGEQWLAAGTDAFDRMWVPLELVDRSTEWLSRSVPSTKVGSIRVLAPEDALVFVSLHTSMHSYVRSPGIRLYVDIDRLVRDRPIDWSRYLEELGETHGRLRAFVSLALCAALLDTPIPAEVFEVLTPTTLRWRALRGLLQRERVIADGRGKLRPGSTLILDALLSERSPKAWLQNVIAPDEAWMRAHFGSNADVSTVKLHIRRLAAVFERWRPE